VRELALFAGAGGGILGGLLLGWRTVCAVEIDAYCRRVLLARQRDGVLPRFPVWDDIRTFDGYPWRGQVDIISGGFPCQDISAAGKGVGIAGSRSGLWFEMFRIVAEVRPRFVYAENSPHLRTRGLGTVVEGLIRLGYDSRWGVLGARHVGANHWRRRMWLLAYSGSSPANSNGEVVWKQPGRGGREGRKSETLPRESNWWDLPRYAGVDDGVAHRMERVRATGNGQVPAVAALAWLVLTNAHDPSDDVASTDGGGNE
jgi:DNA (cytosine-5)-methyltransferase 1